MSRLDKLEEILDSYENHHVDVAEFKKGNPAYSEWFDKLSMAQQIKLDKVINAVTILAAMKGGKDNPLDGTAIYVVGSSVTEDEFDDIDLALVGLKSENIKLGLLDQIANAVAKAVAPENKESVMTNYTTLYGRRHVARIFETGKETPIDFSIGRDGKTIKQWEYSMAAGKERFVHVCGYLNGPNEHYEHVHTNPLKKDAKPENSDIANIWDNYLQGPNVRNNLLNNNLNNLPSHKNIRNLLKNYNKYLSEEEDNQEDIE